MVYMTKCPHCGDTTKFKMSDEDTAFIASEHGGKIECKCWRCGNDFVLDDDYTRTIQECGKMVMYHGDQ